MVIVFEGINGCGKSTQLNRLYEWIKTNTDRLIGKTSWNSYLGLEEFNNSLKREDKYSPMTSFLVHALDFTLRYEQYAKPIIENGGIMLFDRYIYTAYVRDSLRNISKSLLDQVYKAAPIPDLIFFFDISPNSAINRVPNRNVRSAYILGRDLDFHDDLDINFIKYLDAQRELYIKLFTNCSCKVVTINAEEPEDVQFERILKEIEGMLNIQSSGNEVIINCIDKSY